MLRIGAFTIQSTTVSRNGTVTPANRGAADPKQPLFRVLVWLFHRCSTRRLPIFSVIHWLSASRPNHQAPPGLNAGKHAFLGKAVPRPLGHVQMAGDFLQL